MLNRFLYLPILFVSLVQITGAYGEPVSNNPSNVRPPAALAGNETIAAKDAITADTVVPELMSKYHVPGVAVVRIENHKIAWEKYFGVCKEGTPEPVTKDTIFEACSMSKPLVAYVALKMIEQGSLELDKPLASYLPEPYIPDEPLHQKITARMVLQHTSGLPNWRSKEGLKVNFEPGTRHSYSGEGLVFLQRVMEKISGEDLEKLMQRMLLKPLKMEHSSYVWKFPADFAGAHDKNGAPHLRRNFYTKPNAAFSLYTTPHEYAAFVLELMNPDRSAPHSLSADSIKAMFTPGSFPTGRKIPSRSGSQTPGWFGLGLCVQKDAGKTRIFHSGSNRGFRCYHEFSPVTGDGLIIMTNGDSGVDLWRDLIKLIGVF